MPRSLELIETVPLKVVVLVLENNQGEILLTQRKKHQHLAGYWEFPGGKVEAGETPWQALKRECHEELNHPVTSAKEILIIQHDYSSFSVELQVYHEIHTNPQVKPAENQNMQWVNITELNQYKLPKANLAIIQHLQLK